MNLVLASTSVYRKELLSRLGLPFISAAPNIDETPHREESPQRLVARLAEAKARAVAAQYPDALIIGSDQVATVEERILGKPGNHAQAVAQLRLASGKGLCFLTGLCLLNARSGASQTDIVPYTAVFRTLSDAQIENYLNRDQPYHCAGSFKSEALGIALCERFEGEDPNALIGLPLIRLIDMLQREGVDIL